jgi:hypothetical protein
LMPITSYRRQLHVVAYLDRLHPHPLCAMGTRLGLLSPERREHGDAPPARNRFEKRMMSAIPNSPAATRKRERSLPAMSEITKFVTYGAALGGIYLSVGFLFYFAMKEKLFTDGGTMPAPLQKLFAGSFFASVPGDNAAWVLLGLLEALVVVLLAVSLLRGEFLPQRRKPILLAGLSVSLLAFGVMGLANDMIGNNATVIELFTYFGVTIVAMFLIRQMSPYRPMSWLAGEMDD